MGIKDTSKALAAKLRLDSHHAIERFGVVFLGVVASFVVLIAGATTSSIANQRENLDATALYTPSFTTSKTQQSGSVEGVFVNSNRSRALLLMQFQDPAAMSSSATNYQGFLTGATSDLSDQPLRTDVRGEIVVFGSTGYVGMLLDSEAPFEQQIVNLTMRANAELVYKPSESRKVREDLVGQKTFVEYDQWRLYFNPGAKGAEVLSALDSETPNAAAIYDELVIKERESAIHKTLDEQLAQMRTAIQNIDEYTAEAARVDVDGVFLQTPEVPPHISSDEITGQPAVDETPSTLALETDWVAPGGFDFDWRAGSVGQGYLDELVPSEESYVTWLADAAAQRRGSGRDSMQVRELPWVLSNGLELSQFNSDTASMRPLVEIKNGLSQAYQELYKHKVAYQTDSLAMLLELEVELRNVERNTSTNDDAKALFTY